MAKLDVHRTDSPVRLIIAWDNRSIPRQGYLTVVLPMFWCFWTAAAVYGTWLIATDNSPRWSAFDWVGVLMVAFAYLGVFGIPLTWLLRHTEERIEISSEEYRHFYVKYPWFSPIRWPLSEFSRVEIGHRVNAVDEIDAVATLNVYARHKRDIIAYWADDDFKHEIFCYLRDHIHSLNLPIECRDSLRTEVPVID